MDWLADIVRYRRAQARLWDMLKQDYAFAPHVVALPSACSFYRTNARLASGGWLKAVLCFVLFWVWRIRAHSRQNQPFDERHSARLLKKPGWHRIMTEV